MSDGNDDMAGPQPDHTPADAMPDAPLEPKPEVDFHVVMREMVGAFDHMAAMMGATLQAVPMLHMMGPRLDALKTRLDAARTALLG